MLAPAAEVITLHLAISPYISQVLSPAVGDAVAFYNYEPSGELDPYAIHAGLPAPDVRHVAALWFHV